MTAVPYSPSSHLNDVNDVAFLVAEAIYALDSSIAVGRVGEPGEVRLVLRDGRMYEFTVVEVEEPKKPE